MCLRPDMRSADKLSKKLLSQILNWLCRLNVISLSLGLLDSHLYAVIFQIIHIICSKSSQEFLKGVLELSSVYSIEQLCWLELRTTV